MLGGPSIPVGGVLLRIDHKCPVFVTAIDSGECIDSANTTFTTSSTTAASSSSEGFATSMAGIIGGMIVVVILLIVALIFAITMYCHGKRSSK